ncbi:hypothetical protein [Mycetocola reblochoni]|uniref:hypothetical protein n=1 Tax=Mycetocola reblochoni TaxID=331618 RepID=UPI003F9BEE34
MSTATGAIRTIAPSTVSGGYNVRFDPYPFDSRLRWLVRLLAAVPFLLLVALADPRLWDGLSSPNAALIEHARSIAFTGSTVTWMESLYPPLPTIAAALLPWGTTGLAVVGALAAGAFTQRIIEVLHQHRAGALLGTLFTLALVANPLFAYTATQNLPAFLSIMFFGIGLNDTVRFITWRNTQAGFRAGLYLMLSALSDTSGLAFVAALVLAAPLFTLGRRGERGVRTANSVVLGFPTVAVLATVLFLQLAFLHRWPAGDSFGFGYSADALQGLVDTTHDLRWLGLLAPLLCLYALSLLVRRPGAMLVGSLLFALVMAGFVFGLVPTGSAGNSFIILTLVMIAILPAARTRRMTTGIAIVAAVTVLVPWLAALTRTSVMEWTGTLFTALPW